MRRTVVVLVAAVALTACAADQEPELVPSDGISTSTTSRTLDTCPAGGPDATTEPAGCIAADGSVQRP